MVSDRIRVLHVLGRMDPGGVETWLMHVLRHIDRQKFQMDFCTLSGQPGLFDREIETLGSKVIPCRLGRNPFLFARRFRRILREGRYDVVHSHVHHFSGAILRWVHAERVPIRIAHSHNTSDGKPSSRSRRIYRMWMVSWIQRYITHGLACSKEAAAALFGDGWGTDDRFRVLYYGIDLGPFEAPFNRSEVRRELGIPADAPVVGHVGRFNPQKNHSFLLQVAAAVAEIRPQVHFLFVGDGPLRPEIEAQARDLGLSDRVHFAGIQRDVPRLMRGCMDVFLMPSLFEGLPLVLLEAQAAGLPCVLSDVIAESADVVRPLLRRLSLSQPASAWGEAVLTARTAAEVITPAEALAMIKQSPFNIISSAKALERVYAGK